MDTGVGMLYPHWGVINKIEQGGRKSGHILWSVKQFRFPYTSRPFPKRLDILKTVDEDKQETVFIKEHCPDSITVNLF